MNLAHPQTSTGQRGEVAFLSGGPWEMSPPKEQVPGRAAIIPATPALLLVCSAQDMLSVLPADHTRSLEPPCELCPLPPTQTHTCQKHDSLYPEAEACFPLDIYGTGHAGVARIDATPVCAGCTSPTTRTLSVEIKETRPHLLPAPGPDQGLRTQFPVPGSGEWFLLPHAGLAQSRIEY